MDITIKLQSEVTISVAAFQCTLVSVPIWTFQTYPSHIAGPMMIVYGEADEIDFNTSVEYLTSILLSCDIMVSRS